MPVVINGTTGITNVNGSAAAPAETGTDTDTGIYYGTNTVGLATNGTNALFVDTSQNVGIGTTSPGVKLDVNGALRVGLASNPTTIANNSQFYDQSGIGPTISGYNFQVRTGNPTPTASLFVDSANNVGIGTTSPASKLDARTSGNGNISGPSTGTWTARVVHNNDASGGNGLSVQNRWASTNSIIFECAMGWNGTATGYYPVFTIDGLGQCIWANNSPATERMRLDTSGNLLVGTTAPLNGSRFYTVATGSAIAGGFKNDTAGYQTIQVWNAAAAGTRNLIQFSAGTGGTSVGTVSTDGTNTTYGTSSDYRLKENIQPMTGALEKVAQLKPCTYTWKGTGAPGQGFIAHELQAVVPDAVVGEKDAVNEDGSIRPQNIDTSFLVATLTAAIQELKTQNDELRARVAALEGAK